MNQGYSYCPYCLKLASSRTRGIPTYDRCELGHQWVASEGVYPKPVPATNSPIPLIDGLLKAVYQIRRVQLYPRSEDTAVTLHCRINGVGTEYTFSCPDGVAILLQRLAQVQQEAEEANGV